MDFLKMNIRPLTAVFDLDIKKHLIANTKSHSLKIVVPFHYTYQDLITKLREILVKKTVTLWDEKYSSG